MEKVSFLNKHLQDAPGSVPDIILITLLSYMKTLQLLVALFQNISYHLFSFRGSIRDYKIHMDMEIVKFT